MLCRTCRAYPRHIEEFEGVREISLSLSCPEAAKLILDCEEPVRFLSKETEKEETYPYFDFFLYTKLMDCRDFIISTLQNRELDWNLRTGIVLGLAHDLQRRIVNDRLYETDSLASKNGLPKCIVLDTVKGKGWSVTEGRGLSGSWLPGF